ncbi:MAG: hypothetical protein KAJ14_03490 [Candidatus Omnitrophica bacterium]|nr:hypothetical protein [Candidatus Omnitrophota bacterium]
MKRLRTKIISIILIQLLFLQTAIGVVVAAENVTEKKLFQSTLSPRLNFPIPVFQRLYDNFFPVILEPGVVPYHVPFGYDTALKAVPDEQDKIEDLKLLNIMFQSQGGEAVINAILDNPEQMKMISKIILAQDRMADTHGYIVNRWWAEEFKYEALKRAINALKGYDFIFLQMEYQLSSKFLEEFKSHLKSMGLNEGESIYATGQLAKLQMAGGLGSFKPDLVRGYFDVLKKFWGEIEAKNRTILLPFLACWLSV